MNITATRSTTGTQLPVAQARIDLYLQGATVEATTVVTTSANVPVFASGRLFDGAYVQAGLGGPILQVVSVTSPGDVTLQNLADVAVTIEAGVRLIMLSARPAAFQDALGTINLGNSFTADSGGRARVFVAEGQYDYIISDPADPAVTIDTPTNNTLSGASSSLSISHTVASGQSALLAVIAWQEATDTETLVSVKWNGTDMTLLAASDLLAVYYLPSPATGSHSVVATWSGSSGKAAYAEVFTVANGNAEQLIGALTTRTGSGTTAGMPAAGSVPRGLILGAIGVIAVPGSTTASLVGGPTSLWNLSVGSSGAGTATLTAGAKASGNGSIVNVTWTLSASRAWTSVSFEVLPAWNALITNAQAGECCSFRFGLLATDYTSLQAAIDALPASGGLLQIPAGTYKLTSGLVIDKRNVTLVGEGADTLITPADPESLPIDLLTVRAQRARLMNLRFDGAATEPDFETGTCGIVFSGETTPVLRLVQHCYMENVVVQGTSRYAVRFIDTIVVTSINCEFNQNLGGGVRIEGGEAGGICSQLVFIGCSMSSNGGIGVNVGTGPDVGMENISLINCTIETNGASIPTEDLEDIGVGVNGVWCEKIDIIGCFFENPPDQCVQMIRLESCPNAVVDRCVLSGTVPEEETPPLRGIHFVGCNEAYCTNNVLKDFTDEVIRFDEFSNKCVEMCNRDYGASPARIVVGGSVIGTSQSVLTIPFYPVNGDRPSPSSVRPGSIIWVQSPSSGSSHLQGSNGTSWIDF